MSKKQPELKKNTYFNFLLWYNNIELKEVVKMCEGKVSYQTLHKLKRGAKHKYSLITLETIALKINVKLSEIYDWEKQDYIYFEY